MKKTITPDELISLLQAKNEQGFELLYERYGKALYHISCKIVQDDTLAEDVLQDSFVKIWQHIAYYDCSKGTFFTWMLNITRNTAIDYIRSLEHKQKRRTHSVSAQLTHIDQHLAIEPCIDEIGMDVSLRALSAPQQAIIEYVYVKGYSQKETAHVLQLPLGTVKTRARSALSKLKLWML